MAPYTSLPPRDVSPFAAAEVEAYAHEKDLDGLFRALMSRFPGASLGPCGLRLRRARGRRHPDRAAARGWTTLAPNRSPPDHPDRLRAITTPSRDDDSVPTPEREKTNSHVRSDPAPLAIGREPRAPTLRPRRVRHRARRRIPSISPRRPDRDREGEAEAVDDERRE